MRAAFWRRPKPHADQRSDGTAELEQAREQLRRIERTNAAVKQVAGEIHQRVVVENHLSDAIKEWMMTHYRPRRS